MKIALIGYGKMGKTIESIIQAQYPKLEVVLKISNANKQELTIENLQQCDVAIEFSQPASAYEHVKLCFEAGIPVVCGTTGWYDQLEMLKAEASAGKGSFFYGTNLSIGVNILFQINKQLAAIMQGKAYQASIAETHHIHKLDKPSGTALTLAEGLIQNNADYTSWQLNEGNSAEAGILPVIAIREDEVPGTHVITYSSDIDSIELKHTAFSRAGFAQGAIIAAIWMQGRKGFFGMDNLLADPQHFSS